MKWTKKGHQFDTIGEKIIQKKYFYIYGAGENGKYTFEQIKFIDYAAPGAVVKQKSFCGFIDRDLQKKECGYLGEKVYTLEEVLKENEHRMEEVCIIVAVSNANRANVVKKLTGYGLFEGTDFFEYRHFVEVYLPVYAAYRFNKVYYKSITYIPTRKCPLRCKNCLNFIPYIENPTEDSIEIVKKDLDRLFSCIDYTNRLSLAGGEIFLHSHYKELFKYIGENYRNKIATLAVTTSTVILPDDETFRLFKKYGFTIHVSDYRSSGLPGIEKKYRDFVEKLKEFQVDHVLFEDHEWLDLDVFRKKEMYTEEQEKINHFDACGIPWGYYKDGRLWPCAWHALAVEAGVKPECETDYYDLRSYTVEKEAVEGEKTVFEFQQEKCRELMEFGMGYSEKGYMEMCSKCNGNSTINFHFIPPAVQLPRKK